MDKNSESTLTVYAPVIIPTCNRYEHLRECVESLAECTHADKTELIISVDFPPDESYADGWNKVREYVSGINEGGGRFKTVTVYYQESNLGPYENSRFLKSKAEEQYEYYIVTEDDNIFAPAFLDYMNKMLKLFKDDASVMNISGFNYGKHNFTASIYKGQDVMPWGMGCWKEKERLYSESNVEMYKRSARKISRVLNMYFNNKWVFCVFVGHLTSGNIPPHSGVDGDRMITNYCRNTFVVYPTKSLTKNIGFNDGSGVHAVTGKTYDVAPEMDLVEMDERRLFDYEIDLRHIPVTRKRFWKLPPWVIRSSRFKVAPLSYILYRIMGEKRYLRWKNRKFAAVKSD